MSETFLPELHTREARHAVAELVLALFERWGLQEQTQGELLGVADIAPYRSGAPLPDAPEVLERAGYLLALDRAVQRRYRSEPLMREGWVAVPSAQLEGAVPLALMLQGLDGLKRVHDELLAEERPAPRRI